MNRRTEEAVVTYADPPVVIARTDGRRWLGYEADARLIALTPQLAVIAADMADELENARDWVPRSQRENILALDHRFRALTSQEPDASTD